MVSRSEGTVAKNRPDIVLLLLLAVSLGLNFFLGLQLLRARRIPVTPAPPALAVGTELPPLDGEDLTGRPMIVDYVQRTRPVLIYVFSPDCPWCLRNIPNLKVIAEATRQRYDFVAVSLNPDRDAVAGHLAKNDLRLRVMLRPSRRTTQAYRLGSVTMCSPPDPWQQECFVCFTYHEQCTGDPPVCTHAVSCYAASSWFCAW